MDRVFLQANARWLSAGVVLTLCSSFGQTYFISIFADRIMGEYGLTDGQWGAIYTVATLASAATLLFAGSLADRVRVSRLATLILIGYAAIAVGMALNENVYVLIFLIFGLRFCGQGMISHVGITAMARWFRAHRGRAVAIAGLGYSVGEALLPGAAALAEPLIGWRTTWLVVAALLILIFLPFVAWLARDERSPRGNADADHHPGRDGHTWSRRDVLRHRLFLALLPAVVASSFIGTVVFFQIAHIAGAMGWQKLEMTAAYPVYAGTTIGVSLLAGWAVDRWGPDRLLPWFLLPLGMGVAFIGPFAGLWSWFLALGLSGITTGIAHAMWGAYWAEIYGTRHIGGIKAIASSAMVMGSAIGPGITGFVIDLGVGFAGQAPWMAASVVAISLLNAWVVARLPARTEPAETAV
ncbi:MAG: MFS transporter [Pseudomonadota bacterium]